MAAAAAATQLTLTSTSTGRKRARTWGERTYVGVSREMGRYPVLADVEAVVGAPREVVLACLGPVVATWYGVGLKARLFVTVVCLAYPIAACWRTLRAMARMREAAVDDEATDRAPSDTRSLRMESVQWLSYWILYGAFWLLESVALDWIIATFPFWWAFKLGFFVFLQAPSTRGATQVYERLFAPVLRQQRAHRAFHSSHRGSSSRRARWARLGSVRHTVARKPALVATSSIR